MLHPLNEPVSVFLAIMGVILITPMLSRRVRLPGIVGLILGGLLVGPYVLGLLSMNPTIELLGTVGLVYLMFSAGLEINLRQFARVRTKAMVFGVLTFLIPQVVLTLVGRAFGLSWLSSILLGSTFASHTLIAYPILSRFGIVRSEAIAIVVGATVFTDVAALLVLAVVASITGDGGVTPWAIARLLLLMAGYAAIVLLGLPRLGKAFFRRFSGHDTEFQFVLVTLFAASVLAEFIGMHAIVGAFLAGLAINAALPQHSTVASQTLFLGHSFFIPMFMIYVGMSVDPVAFVTDTRALLVGLVAAVATYAAKFLAAWVTSRIYRFGGNELMVFWGLSQAQAAATIATILVGLELGLFDRTIFNGTILVVLATSITSPILVERFGSRIKMPLPPVEPKAIFDRILVPLANPASQEPLLTLASILCSDRSGTLLPLNVARETDFGIEGRAQQKQLLEDVPQVLANPDVSIEPVYRVGRSLGRSICRAAIETDASLIIMGWPSRPSIEGRVFGTVLDQVVWHAGAPVMVARITAPINSIERVCFVIPVGSLQSTLVDETLRVLMATASTLNAPLRIFAASNYEHAIGNYLRRSESDVPTSVASLTGSVVDQVAAIATVSDLVVVPTSGSRLRFTSSLGHIPEELAKRIRSSLLVIHW